MASIYGRTILISFFVILISAALLHQCSAATPRKLALVKTPPLILKYHKGALLKGNITLNLIWYGKFSPAQRSVIVDFLHSLTPRRAAHSTPPPPPSVSSWWQTTQKYLQAPSNVIVGTQTLDPNYSLGKNLKNSHVIALASKTRKVNAVNVVLTSSDVAVEGFCMSRCGSHESTRVKRTKFAYAWVGNSVSQCPGQCAWPFYKPLFGPQTPPLVAPNGDVGVDGMVINLATVLSGTVTNPFDGGYFQGPASAPLEAVSACTGMFGSGAFPGFPGTVLVDKATGASYNAQGVNRRKYLLPAMWDPETSTCKTLV